MPPKLVPIYYDDEPLEDDKKEVLMGEIQKIHGKLMTTAYYDMVEESKIISIIRAVHEPVELEVKVTEKGIYYYPMMILPGAATEAGGRYSHLPPRAAGAGAGGMSGLEGPVRNLKLGNKTRGRAKSRSRSRSRSRNRKNGAKNKKPEVGLEELIAHMKSSFKKPDSQ